MNDGSRPNLVLIAGPNGAGKSTVASFLLTKQSITRFINADTIARGMSVADGDSEQLGAGRVMLAQIRIGIEAGEGVAFETTLSGKGWRNLISEAKRRGYEITICFVGLRSSEIATERVAKRVALGGHSIPEPTIKRRFQRSIDLFFSMYQPLCDNWYLFDNSGKSAELIAALETPKPLRIFNQEAYDYFKALALRST